MSLLYKVLVNLEQRKAEERRAQSGLLTDEGDDTVATSQPGAAVGEEPSSLEMEAPFLIPAVQRSRKKSPPSRLIPIVFIVTLLAAIVWWGPGLLAGFSANTDLAGSLLRVPGVMQLAALVGMEIPRRAPGPATRPVVEPIRPPPVPAKPESSVKTEPPLAIADVSAAMKEPTVVPEPRPPAAVKEPTAGPEPPRTVAVQVETPLAVDGPATVRVEAKTTSATIVAEMESPGPKGAVPVLTIGEPEKKPLPSPSPPVTTVIPPAPVAPAMETAEKPQPKTIVPPVEETVEPVVEPEVATEGEPRYRHPDPPATARLRSPPVRSAAASAPPAPKRERTRRESRDDRIRKALLRARAALAVGDLPAAGEILSKLPDEGGNRLDRLSTRAAWRAKRGDHERAARLYGQLIGLEPEQGRWWLGLAIAQDRLQRWGAAAFAYRQAVGSAALEPSVRDFARSRLQTLSDSEGR